MTSSSMFVDISSAENSLRPNCQNAAHELFRKVEGSPFERKVSATAQARLLGSVWLPRGSGGYHSKAPYETRNSGEKGPGNPSSVTP